MDVYFYFVIVWSDIEVEEKQISQRLIWANSKAMLLSSILCPKPFLLGLSKLLPIFPGGRSHFSLNFLGQLGPQKIAVNGQWNIGHCQIWILHSTSHAKMHASAKYHCHTTNSYWETDLNRKTLESLDPQIFIMWPSFELQLDIIKKNILSVIHDDYFKTVISKIITRFSFDLAWWPIFDPKWSSFELDLEIIKTNILNNILDD